VNVNSILKQHGLNSNWANGNDLQLGVGGNTWKLHLPLSFTLLYLLKTAEHQLADILIIPQREFIKKLKRDFNNVIVLTVTFV
jgi:hypothetical protein